MTFVGSFQFSIFYISMVRLKNKDDNLKVEVLNSQRSGENEIGALCLRVI